MVKPDMLKIFIGFDPRQPVSFTVLAHSIAIRSTKPISITPLIIETLPIKRTGLTPFTFSRFLVPWLCNYGGWALFLDADILLQDDISELFNLSDDKYAVMVSKNRIAFEWASVMLFNNSKCKILTPEYIEDASKLHSIGFVEPELVGELPNKWNHLVGYDAPSENPSLVHYTQGVPFPRWPTNDCEHNEAFMEVLNFSVSAQPWENIMGASVHTGADMEGRRVPLYKLNPDYKSAQTANLR